MNELFLCPDCLVLHAEPLAATLGHLARCFTCAVAAELAAEPPGAPHSEPTPLRPAA